MSTFLQFSGGRDSLACLYLLEPHWPELTVVWCNSGAAFPETVEQMQRIRAMVPHFHEVRSRQSIDTEGYPVDVLPISHTSMGQRFEGNKPERYQSRYSCCAAALWLPMQQAMKDLGATVIIRGEKASDKKKSGFSSGMVVEGVRYEFPLEHWSDGDVERYLQERGVKLPRNYAYMDTGLDCWNCTAYLDENEGKSEYMRRFHPEKHARVRKVLSDLNRTLSDELQPLRQVIS